MTSSSRIPHLLEPYLELPPEGSLTLLTSILGANANWLVLRHLYSNLRGSSGEDRDTGVVLVSFLRDVAFWRDGAAKMGLDLDAMSRAGRVVLVDGLTGLVTGEVPPASTARKERVLRGSKIADIQKELEAAVADLRTTRKVLVVDQLDALLAVTDETTTSLTLQNLLLSLRSLVHSTVATLSADTPLVAAQATSLEREHACLVLSTAHAADAVLALRMLDTGVARDVSGVVRLTGPAIDGGEPAEFLYHVAADGGVKVFERGS
ncbi:hypothetical protein B0J13DRAFT_187813 [Dactylonectria estremocensis]|uniref:Elongator complex protein 6 n=1 Tax=Dactylonectria estremocensis TaxID=1079267 RepID=A0A9P9FDY1_9HYPO|nr:hypothetical protein B0J13DRAFT_187813 [Dactylonectria estremocensis]